MRVTLVTLVYMSRKSTVETSSAAKVINAHTACLSIRFDRSPSANCKGRIKEPLPPPVLTRYNMNHLFTEHRIPQLSLVQRRQSPRFSSLSSGRFAGRGQLYWCASSRTCMHVVMCHTCLLARFVYEISNSRPWL